MSGAVPITTHQLVIYLEGQALRTVPLIGSEATVGRDATNTLVLELQPTSRRHAKLSVEDAGVLLKDIGSSHGTFINGEKLLPDQPRLLANGDTFQIGPYLVVYQVVKQPDVLDAAPQPSSEAPQEAAPPALPPDIVLVPHAAQPQPLPVFRPPQMYPPTLPEREQQSRYLQSLPIIFHGNDFFNRYLLLFESLWEPLEQRHDHIDMYFDPQTCPETFLPWLAGWFDIAVDQHWPEVRRRQLLSVAVELYRKRGTRDGLSHMLEVCTGLTPHITDLSSPQQDEPAQPFVFRVRLAIPEGSDVDREFVEQIIRAHKPAHASYILELSV